MTNHWGRLTKSDLVERLADREGMTKVESKRVIEALFDTDDGIIATALQDKEKVQITGFGTFQARKRKSRMGRNPQTGEKIRIPASVTVSFRSGKGLKEAVN